MKRCPLCDSSFPDTDQYCELDGAQLVSDYSSKIDASREVGQAGSPGYSHRQGSPEWKIFAVLAVAVAGVATVLFFVYQQTQTPNDSSSDESSNASSTQQSVPLMTARPVPFASVSPSPDASPSPSATASPSAQSDPARAVLSSSPVSTGPEETLKSGTLVIRLRNGTSVEADEVWETGEGIWYRRSGVVTLLERNQVTTIVRTPPAASPVATPAISPSASP